MLESLLFVFTLLAACLVMVWAARNDQQERSTGLDKAGEDAEPLTEPDGVEQANPQASRIA